MLSEEEKLLMGFIIAKGSQSPRNTASRRATTLRPNTINFKLKSIAAQLDHIKHWKIIHGDYRVVKNCNATWFVDPPYQIGGHVYKHGVSDISLPELADWCRTRKGQVIICENTKADWMPFKPIIRQKGSVYTTTEAIWSNYPTNYDNVQIKMEI